MTEEETLPQPHGDRIRWHESGRDPQTPDEELAESEAAVRWRRALLRLSENFMSAADERSDLSPILLGALHNALEQLLLYGEEGDLMALEEWLSEGEPEVRERQAGQERRTQSDRRAGRERRSGTDRRA
jgi:hypothetical protein